MDNLNFLIIAISDYQMVCFCGAPSCICLGIPQVKTTFHLLVNNSDGNITSLKNCESEIAASANELFKINTQPSVSNNAQCYNWSFSSLSSPVQLSEENICTNNRKNISVGSTGEIKMCCKYLVMLFILIVTKGQVTVPF